MKYATPDEIVVDLFRNSSESELMDFMGVGRENLLELWHRGGQPIKNKYKLEDGDNPHMLGHTLDGMGVLILDKLWSYIVEVAGPLRREAVLATRANVQAREEAYKCS